ncbi:hypothetical protein [Bacteroides sp.]|uniref:hypothetical protein n=1 Tax=Bacteroides sp. TaxID=29523 RepID=UPI0026245DB0|nr:hypothetical protein [Bacteroides sp.]MDD3039045.1 hypothetical protein [Bacteroides sp.]
MHNPEIEELAPSIQPHTVTELGTSFSIGTFDGLEDIEIIDDDTNELIEILPNVPRLIIDNDTPDGILIYGFECYWTELTPNLERIFKTSLHTKTSAPDPNTNPTTDPTSNPTTNPTNNTNQKPLHPVYIAYINKIVKKIFART